MSNVAKKEYCFRIYGDVSFCVFYDSCKARQSYSNKEQQGRCMQQLEEDELSLKDSELVSLLINKTTKVCDKPFQQMHAIPRESVKIKKA